MARRRADGVAHAIDDLRGRGDGGSRGGRVEDDGPEGFGPGFCLAVVERGEEGDADGVEGDGGGVGGVRLGSVSGVFWGRREGSEEALERFYVGQRRGDEDEDGVGGWVAFEGCAEVFGEGIAA